MLNIDLIVVLLLATYLHATWARGTDGVQGPEPLNRHRRYSNFQDCPYSWKYQPPAPPGPTCPPGYMRPHTGIHLQSFPACPPWVDASGDCHLSDRTFPGERCRSVYGEVAYAEFQRNARLTRPAGPPGPPAPPCEPMIG